MSAVKKLPISKIIVDDTFNSRKTTTGVESLKRAIDAQGLDNFLTVWERDDGSYFLVSGFRRLRALKELGHKTAECLIRRYDNVAEAFSANIAENIERADVRPADVAQAVMRLKNDFGMTPKDICRMVGLDVSMVYKYSTIEEKVSPEILGFWHNPNLPIVIPIEVLLKWASVPDHGKQLLLMKEWQGDVETAKLMKMPRNASQKTRSKGDMRAMLATLQERKDSESEFNQGACAAIEWALKEKKGIKNG